MFSILGGGPLRFGPQDTPRPGRTVTWRSADPADPAIVDGGTAITEWRASPHVAGALVAALPASISRGVTLRQLWVGGRRATRPVQYAVNLDGPSSTLAFSLFRTRITIICYAFRVETGPYFVPGLSHGMLIELRQALVSYQDYHMVCVSS